MPIEDERLKRDLTTGVETCGKFSSCLPIAEYENLSYGRDIAPAVMFLNCLKGKRMEACIKKDLRERILDFIQVYVLSKYFTYINGHIKIKISLRSKSLAESNMFFSNCILFNVYDSPEIYPVLLYGCVGSRP